MSERLAQYRFAHYRLDVYRLALRLAVMAEGMVKGMARGDRGLADQLSRSATAVVLLIAEGANRASGAQKRQRFVEARGECGEAAAAVELLGCLHRVRQEDVEPFLALADRIAAMLSGLIRSHS